MGDSIAIQVGQIVMVMIMVIVVTMMGKGMAMAMMLAMAMMMTMAMVMAMARRCESGEPPRNHPFALNRVPKRVNLQCQESTTPV